MASTNSGSAWSIADDRDHTTRDQAYQRSPARFVMVTIPGGAVPGLTWQWRTHDGRRQGLTFYPSRVTPGDGVADRWVDLQEWVDVDRLTPAEDT